MQNQVVIIGAGAAGLMCAIEAGRRGKKVVVVEQNHRIGNKILISGGGRCNFTNLYSGPQNFISANPHFCKSALARFGPHDFLELVRKHQVPYFEKKAGQLFCRISAKEIVRMLLQEALSAGAEIKPSCTVHSVEKKQAHFLLKTSQGELGAHSLVIATGGLSFPHLGATDFGYKVAKQFGLRLIDCAPALVPLVFSPEDQRWFAALAGIALDALVCCRKKSFRENILFTHSGLSGPAILQSSSYWNPGEEVQIDFLPLLDLFAFLMEKKNQQEKSLLKNVLSQFIPKKMAERWCARYGFDYPVHACPEKKMRELSSSLKEWRVVPARTEGYSKAEVTRGGVDTSELSSQTMESKKVPGLYFVGEVVDVTGQLGGHNFQWAWASGSAAGRSV